MDRLFDVLGSIVTVALVFTIVSNKNTSAVINSAGSAFSGAIKAATGR